jgi:uncharacterized protein YgiM (DUF1202 family)
MKILMVLALMILTSCDAMAVQPMITNTLPVRTQPATETSTPVHLSPTGVNTATLIVTYVIRTEILNIRSGPGTSYSVIGYLRAGDVVSAKCDGNWCILDTKGYVLKACLTGGVCRGSH